MFVLGTGFSAYVSTGGACRTCRAPGQLHHRQDGLRYPPEEWSLGFSARAEAALKERAPGYFRGFCPPASTWLDAALYPGGQGLLAVLRDVTGQVLAEERVHRALAVVEASRSELESLTRPKLKGNRKVVAIA